jgi:hypothetical protein
MQDRSEEGNRTESKTADDALNEIRLDEAKHEPIPFHLSQLRKIAGRGFTVAEQTR